jgi:threonyl-tRNA synthetase
VYLEHCAGAFPVWLAPTQAKIIPISADFNGYAEDVLAEMKALGLRVELDDRNESLNYRIRDAQMNKIPYMFVIGKQEVEARSLAVRHRAGGRQQVHTLDDTKRLLLEERDTKATESRLVPPAPPAPAAEAQA